MPTQLPEGWPLEDFELEELHAELVRARARGIRSTMYDGRRVDYATDAEMAAAIADLEKRIATMKGAGGNRPRVVRFTSSKGF